jgi:hypothetical protein
MKLRGLLSQSSFVLPPTVPNFSELRYGEVRRIPLPRTPVNRWKDIREAEGLTSPAFVLRC